MKRTYPPEFFFEKSHDCSAVGALSPPPSFKVRTLPFRATRLTCSDPIQMTSDDWPYLFPTLIVVMQIHFVVVMSKYYSCCITGDRFFATLALALAPFYFLFPLTFYDSIPV